MSALPPDYDSDPGRWASHDRSWQLADDTHEMVARRIVAAGLVPVLDLGCGQGRLGELLPDDAGWVGLDASPTQLGGELPGPAVLGDATRLPFADAAFSAVAALWLLHHVDEPTVAIEEARRVLRTGGVFYTCASARDNDPELTDSYPTTPFDAEEAAEITASVFGATSVEVMRWDAPLVRLKDRAAVARYLRSHLLPAEIVDRVVPPLTLTKRGCLVVATA